MVEANEPSFFLHRPSGVKLTHELVSYRLLNNQMFGIDYCLDTVMPVIDDQITSEQTG